MQCCLISFLPTVELLSKLESILSNPSVALSTKSFVAMSILFTASSPGVDYISRKPFLSSVRSNSSSIQISSGDVNNSVTSSGSTSNISSLAVSTNYTSAGTSSTEVLNPSRVVHEGWNPLLPNSY